MAALLDNLRALHACLKSDDPPGDAVKAHNIVGDVGHTCLQDVTERNIGNLEINALVAFVFTSIITQSALHQERQD